MAYEDAVRRHWARKWMNGDVEKAPISEQLRKNYVVALDRSGRLEDALKQMDVMIKPAPFKGSLLELKAGVLFRNKKNREAAECLMLLLLVDRENITPINLLGKILKELEPDCHPMTRDGSGAWRLDLGDRTVLAYLSQACRKYYDLLEERGNWVEKARLVRTARHLYGIELESDDSGQA